MAEAAARRTQGSASARAAIGSEIPRTRTGIAGLMTSANFQLTHINTATSTLPPRDAAAPATPAAPIATTPAPTPAVAPPAAPPAAPAMPSGCRQRPPRGRWWKPWKRAGPAAPRRPAPARQRPPQAWAATPILHRPTHNTRTASAGWTMCWVSSRANHYFSSAAVSPTNGPVFKNSGVGINRNGGSESSASRTGR